MLVCGSDLLYSFGIPGAWIRDQVCLSPNMLILYSVGAYSFYLSHLILEHYCITIEDNDLILKHGHF